MNEQRKLTAVPAARMSPRAYKWFRRTVIAAFLFAALTGPFALIVSQRAANTQPIIPESFPAQASGFAETVAADWLAGGCTVLPVAEGVDACFGRDLQRSGGPKPVPHDGSLTLYSTSESTLQVGAETTVEVFTSTFQYTTDDQVLRLSIPVRFVRISESSRTYPILAAAPSLMPARVAPSSRAPGIGYTDSLAKLTPSAELTQAVNRWANAYAADDRDALRLAVGGGPDGAYPGLGGMTVTKATLNAGVARVDGFHFLRVSLALQASSANEWLSSIELDLLVENATGLDPRIVAWGPAGSGPTLTPYENNLAQG